ncbi:hypothetical protein [Neotamlana laminarinivorans]|uniref:TonB-like protein n=1 Tax=Neotamlana laminarinivorans TaxID=2883124 RepID=A0A9X1I0N6_9FLAO|nr:hypothetical protein [Tamlana laminarinivorans]MCB4798408.1 hypothetical protein [Tamlana laminarinivorans]
MKGLFSLKLIIFFSLSILQAQDIHVLAYSDYDVTVFETEAYQEYLNKVNKQSISFQNKLKESKLKAVYKTGSGFSQSFFNLVKSEKKENINKVENEIHFKLDYIINETGEKVLACAVYFPKEQVFLSASEIQAVLEEAMTHKFNYINKPKAISKFYFKVICTYNNLL